MSNLKLEHRSITKFLTKAVASRILAHWLDIHGDPKSETLLEARTEEIINKFENFVLTDRRVIVVILQMKWEHEKLGFLKF